jgi:PAS domain S-box-containing protein
VRAAVERSRDDLLREIEALRESERGHVSLLQRLRVGLAVHGPDGVFQFGNDEASRILGLSLEQMQGKALTDTAWRLVREDGSALPPDEYPVARMLASLQPLEEQVIGVDRPGVGDRLWALVRGYPELGPQGDLRRIVVTFDDITERRRIEAALQESEGRLKRAHRAARMGNWEWDLATNELYWAEENYRLHGMDPQQVKPSYQAFLDVVDPAEHELINKSVADALAGRSDFEIEYTVIRPDDGRRRVIHARADVIRDGAGNAVRMVGTVQDITERRQANEELRQSEEKYRLLFSEMQEGFALCEVITDESGKAVDFRFDAANEAYERHTGFKPRDVIGKTMLQTLPQADPRQIEAFGEVALTGRPQVFEYFSKAYGRHLRVRAFSPKRGTFATVFEDVGVQVRAQEALRASEERFRALFQQSPDAVILMDPETTLPIEFNDEACRQLGYSREEFARLRIADYEADQATAEIQASIAEALARGTAEFEVRHRTKSGELRDTWVSVRTVEAEGRKVFLSVWRDVSERKRAEETLRQSEEKFRGLVETAQELVWKCDAKGRFAYLNPAWEKTHGYRVEEMLGRAFEEFQPPEIRERDRQEFSRHLAGGSVREYETIHLAKDGRELTLLFNAVPLRNPDGTISGTQGTAIDITDRRRAEAEKTRLEEQLRQSQKMEAVGQLAGGIAHDFNNILAAMILELDMLRLEPKLPPDELGQVVDGLLASAGRAGNLIKQLLLFSRRQAMKTTKHDVNTLVAELTKLLRRLLGEQVTLVVELASEPLWIEGDSGMIEQLVTNLCVNARDAMPRGGRLTIATIPVEVGAEATALRVAARPGQFVCLKVSDTGRGMDAEVLEHIFEPFFTTKEQGRGTGLGLATVHGIAVKHGGWVEVESQVGQGSTFSVYLPRVTASGASEEPGSSVVGRGGDERVLVVEDEAPVRRMAVRCLRQLGYRVSEAANGVEALAIWEREGGAFDLLFTDMVMPEGMSGLELCVRLRQMRPGLKTIVVSGYSAEILDDAETADWDIRYLPKPFDRDALATAVRECLDRKV